MKKQEIKQDPVRDYIVNTYNYFADNKSILYTSISSITAVLLVFIFINNNSTNKLNKSNIVSSSAQNFYIDGEYELAENKFKELLDGNYSQESVNQAIIYKLKDALDNGEDITIFLDKNKFKSKDVFLTTMYNVLVADYKYNLNEHVEAISYYKKALKNFNKYPDILIDAKITLIDIYISLNDLQNAKKENSNVIIDDLSFQSKNKYNSYLKSISDNLK
tara:strand:+ start:52 stop:708 length:657 start_codon:yes stop_codon:yes gene_type:complete